MVTLYIFLLRKITGNDRNPTLHYNSVPRSGMKTVISDTLAGHFSLMILHKCLPLPASGQ